MSIGVPHDPETGTVVLVDRTARKIYDFDPGWARAVASHLRATALAVALSSSSPRPTMVSNCVFHSCLTLPGNSDRRTMNAIIGRVVGVHVADDALTSEGRIDVAARPEWSEEKAEDYGTVEPALQ